MMKKIALFVIGFLVTFLTLAQTPENDLAIIPKPVSVLLKSGSFTLPGKIVIQAPPQAKINRVTTYLKDKLVRATGYPVLIQNKAGKAAITFVLNEN